MKWYAASIIVYVKFDDGNQNSYPVWENIVLISATLDEEAMRKASSIGEESDGDEFTWEGRPASWRYVGTRKLLEVDFDEDIPSLDGTEISYSQLLIRNKDDLLKFIDGKEVKLVNEK